MSKIEEIGIIIEIIGGVITGLLCIVLISMWKKWIEPEWKKENRKKKRKERKRDGYKVCKWKR